MAGLPHKQLFNSSMACAVCFRFNLPDFPVSASESIRASGSAAGLTPEVTDLQWRGPRLLEEGSSMTSGCSELFVSNLNTDK